MIPLRRDISGTRMPTKLIVLCGQQNWRCAYCGVRLVMAPRSHDHAASFDEIVPRSLGGLCEWENQVAACRGCNTARGTMDAIEFYELVRDGKGIGLMRRMLATQAMSRSDGQLPYRENRPAQSLVARLTMLKDAREEVVMTPARAAYFRTVYGFVPGES